MNNPTSTSSKPEPGGTASREQMITAMFAHLVMQHTNMALIFLGHMPNPQTGQVSQDLEHARYFIDQLEMLEVKTKGNLDKQEEAILKQSLTSLRLMYVESVNKPQAPAAPAAEQTPSNAPATDEQETPLAEPALPGEKTPPASESQSAKKFSKKYS
jgi:hypothetical protein